MRTTSSTDRLARLAAGTPSFSFSPQEPPDGNYRCESFDISCSVRTFKPSHERKIAIAIITARVSLHQSERDGAAHHCCRLSLSAPSTSWRDIWPICHRIECCKSIGKLFVLLRRWQRQRTQPDGFDFRIAWVSSLLLLLPPPIAEQQHIFSELLIPAWHERRRRRRREKIKRLKGQ